MRPHALGRMVIGSIAAIGMMMATALSARAAAPATAPVPSLPPMNLWPGAAPGVTPGAGTETDDGKGRAANVTVPTLTAYLPEKGTGTGAAIIVCPGGGYVRVGVGPKGLPAAAHFVPRGVAIFILKYRTSPLPKTWPPTPWPMRSAPSASSAIMLRNGVSIRRRSACSGGRPVRICC